MRRSLRSPPPLSSAPQVETSTTERRSFPSTHAPHQKDQRFQTQQVAGYLVSYLDAHGIIDKLQIPDKGRRDHARVLNQRLACEEQSLQRRLRDCWTRRNNFKGPHFDYRFTPDQGLRLLKSCKETSDWVAEVTAKGRWWREYGRLRSAHLRAAAPSERSALSTNVQRSGGERLILRLMALLSLRSLFCVLKQSLSHLLSSSAPIFSSLPLHPFIYGVSLVLLLVFLQSMYGLSGCKLVPRPQVCGLFLLSGLGRAMFPASCPMLPIQSHRWFSRHVNISLPLHDPFLPSTHLAAQIAHKSSKMTAQRQLRRLRPKEQEF
jgi:hypothetical protein